jgi:hypothetical protein
MPKISVEGLFKIQTKSRAKVRVPKIKQTTRDSRSDAFGALKVGNFSRNEPNWTSSLCTNVTSRHKQGFLFPKDSLPGGLVHEKFCQEQEPKNKNKKQKT